MSLLARAFAQIPSDDLTFLSLVHCPPRTPVPAPPTADERLQAFRSRWRAPAANTWPWRHRIRPVSVAAPHPGA